MASSKKTSVPAGVHYRVEVASAHAHLFRVTLTVYRPAAVQRLTLPVWIPGSYLVREFSKNLQQLQARQGSRPRALQQLDKCSWSVDADPAQPLQLQYEVYALDNSVRTAWLDADRGFFNGTSLCLRVEGQDDAPHVLELVAPDGLAGWEVATGLTPQKINKKGFGRYAAASYDALADSPVEMGRFWSGTFRAAGVPHRFVVAGAAGSFDGARLLLGHLEGEQFGLFYVRGSRGECVRLYELDSLLRGGLGSPDVLAGFHAMGQRSERRTDDSEPMLSGGRQTSWAAISWVCGKRAVYGCCPIVCLIHGDGTPRKDSGHS